VQPQKFRFTKTNIQQLPFSRGGNDRPEYRDTALPGLVLRVGKTAKTYYLYKYNEHLKRHEKLKLGNHLQLIPDTARLKAMELLARGCSAQEMRRQSRSSTIEKLANEFYAEHVLTELRPHSQVQYERQIKRYIIPKWGRRDPASLTRGEIRDYLKARTKESPSQANKLLCVLSSMFSYALRNEFVEVNPCMLIEPNKENKRKRILSDNELVDLLTALNQVEPVKRHYLWLLLLLGQRRSETLLMQWAHFQQKPGVWTLPDHITKNGRIHSVPLPPLAQAHVEALKKITGGVDYCFYSWETRHNRKSGPIDPHYMSEFMARFRASNMPDWERFTLHDFRRTAATNISSIVKDRAKVKLVLNHVNSGDVTGIYDLYSYNEVKLDCLTKWEDRLRSFVPKSVIDSALSD